MIDKRYVLVSLVATLFMESASADFFIKDSKRSGWEINGHNVTTESLPSQPAGDLSTEVITPSEAFEPPSERLPQIEVAVDEVVPSLTPFQDTRTTVVSEPATLVADNAAPSSAPDKFTPPPHSQSVPAPVKVEAPLRKLGECAQFEMRSGLLTNNLNRFLRACDHTIGQWRIGDAQDEFDMVIPKDYTIPVRGLETLLEKIENTYLIRGTINTLDKTVDFEPSRGEIFEGMEIKKW